MGMEFRALDNMRSSAQNACLHRLLNMTFITRLQDAMEAAGVESQADLARRLGLSRGAISLWFNGTTQPSKISGDAQRKAEHVLGVSWDYLVSGHEASFHRPITMLKGDKDGYWTIPRFDVFMQMGVGEEAQHYGDEPDELPGNAFREDFCRSAGWHPSTHFSARVEGDSMIEAGLRSGWTVVVDTTPEAKRIVEGEIYALRENGSGLMCKFLQPQSDGGLHIISANSAHPIYRNPRRLSPEEAEHVEVLGRVVHAQGLLGRRF